MSDATSSEPTSDRATARVLLVDDHEVVRQGLRTLLDDQDDLAVVAEAGTMADAIQRARTFEPDVVVMDVRLPDGSGVEACREIRAARPDTAVVMLTSFSDDEALFDSIMAGAAGFVLKQVRGVDLVDAVRQVAAGASLLDPAVTAQVLARIRDPRGADDPRLARLTPTELRILDLIADGRTNRQIGEHIHLAEKTVKNYVSTILRKLEVSRRAEAAVYRAEHRHQGA